MVLSTGVLPDVATQNKTSNKVALIAATAMSLPVTADTIKAARHITAIPTANTALEFPFVAADNIIVFSVAVVVSLYSLGTMLVSIGVVGKRLLFCRCKIDLPSLE